MIMIMSNTGYHLDSYPHIVLKICSGLPPVWDPTLFVYHCSNTSNIVFSYESSKIHWGGIHRYPLILRVINREGSGVIRYYVSINSSLGGLCDVNREPCGWESLYLHQLLWCTYPYPIQQFPYGMKKIIFTAHAQLQHLLQHYEAA